MQMISKKDLNSAGLETLMKSCSANDSHNRQWISADAYVLENTPVRRTRMFIGRTTVTKKNIS